MKIKTNVRAGAKQNRGAGEVDTSSSSSSTPVYYPPVTRCTGI